MEVDRDDPQTTALLDLSLIPFEQGETTDGCGDAHDEVDVDGDLVPEHDDGGGEGAYVVDALVQQLIIAVF